MKTQPPLASPPAEAGTTHPLVDGSQIVPAAQSALETHSPRHVPSRQTYGAHADAVPSTAITLARSSEQAAAAGTHRLARHVQPLAQSPGVAQLVRHPLVVESHA